MFDVIFQARGTYGVTSHGRTAIGVTRGRVAAWLSPSETQAATRAGVPLIDLGNTFIVPGLWDSHVHLLATGLALTQLDLSPAGNFAELFDLLRRSDDDPLVCCNFDETRLSEGRAPTAREIDAAVTDRPVIIHRVDLHSMVMNSRAWELWGDDSAGPGVDLVAGRPTGAVRGVAFEKIRAAIQRHLDPGVKRRALAAAVAAAAENGVVALGALEGGYGTGTEDLTLLLECQRDLPIEVFVWPQLSDVSAVRRLGLPRWGGCILLDGSFGSWTAALQEAYADNAASHGYLYFNDQELENLVTEAWGAGLQTAFHAIGDRAVHQVIRAYAAAARNLGRYGVRPRIEHGELIADHDLDEMARAGVVLSAQPAFEARWGGPAALYALRLGERWRRTNRFRTAVDNGVRLAFGSDSPITPISPIEGVAAALNHPNPEERLTLGEALTAFTIGAAYACGAERDYGDLRPGQWASFTVLDKDPSSLVPEDIGALAVRATIFRGEIVYGEDNLGHRLKAAS